MNAHSAPLHAYRPDIDGLRALAVSAVVAYHAYPSFLQGGFAGVDVFFVISGFLICRILLSSLERGTFTVTGFYQRRIFRIFPALAAVLLAALLFGWFSLLPSEYTILGKHAAGGAGFIANFLIYKEVGYWDISAQLKPLLHLWSLGVEEQFYILFPCILLIFFKKRNWLTPLIAFLICVSFVYNLYYCDYKPAWDFYSPYTRFWEILVGAMLASIESRRKTLSDCKTVQNLLSILGFALLFSGILFCKTASNYPGIYALLPVLGAACIIVAGPHAWLNHRLLSNKAAVGIGLISYPLYLWHWPILSYLNILGWNRSGVWEWHCIRLSAVFASLLLAFLTYKYIESPIRFGIKKNIRNTTLLVAAVGCVGMAGLCIYLNYGFSSRKSMAQYEARWEERELSLVKGNKEAKIYTKRAAHNYAYRDAGSQTTVAVIGDSHSKHAYFGMAEVNADLGMNTFWIRSRHTDPASGKKNIVELFKEKDDIRAVFLFYKASIYLPEKDAAAMNQAPPETFTPYVQEMVTSFTALGKQVFVVTENPLSPYVPKEYLERPFAYGAQGKPLPPTKGDVLRQQRQYLEFLDQLRGVTVIHSVDTFCPRERCLDVLDGNLLYDDTDHLSATGSLFQARELLFPYLEQIATQAKSAK